MNIISIALFPAGGPVNLNLGEYAKHGDHLSVDVTIEGGVIHLVIEGPRKKSNIYGVPFEIGYETSEDPASPA
jgi:hypothetical protein